jgi:hypothetical protein
VSRRRQELEQEVRERLQRARLQGELERQAAAAEKPGVLDTTGNLTAAQQARARDAVRTQADGGVARFREQFEKEKDARQKAQRLTQQQALDLGRSLGLPDRDGPER